MTNFELIIQNVFTLETFIEALQDDALEAEGCSYDLKIQSTYFDKDGIERVTTWENWLNMEAKNDELNLPNTTIIKWDE